MQYIACALLLLGLFGRGAPAMAQGSPAIHRAANRDPRPALVGSQEVIGLEVAGTNAEGWLPRSRDDLTYSATVPMAGPTETRGPRVRVDVSFGTDQYCASTPGGFTWLGPIGLAGSAVLKREGSPWWIIPTPTCYEFALDPAIVGATGDVDVVAEDGSPAEVRWSRGRVYVRPAQGTTKYRITPANRPRPEMVQADDILLVPGAPVRLTIPTSAQAKVEEAYWALGPELRPPAKLVPAGDGHLLTMPDSASATPGDHIWLAIPAADGTLWLDLLGASRVDPTISAPPIALLRRGEKLAVTASLQNNLKQPATLPLSVRCRGPSIPANPPQKSPAEGGPVPEVRDDAVVVPATTEVNLPAAGAVSVPAQIAFPWEDGNYELTAQTEYPAGVGYEGGVNGYSTFLSARVIHPVLLDLLDTSVPVAKGYRLRGGEETGGLTTMYDGSLFITRESSGGAQRAVIFAHPPWGDGRAGYVFGNYDVVLPAGTHPVLTFAMGIRDGAESTDGVVYRVVVVDARGAMRELSSQQYNEHRWQPVMVDLSRDAGQRITLRLITDCGAADDTNADHALWAEPRIVDQEGRLEVRAPRS